MLYSLTRISTNVKTGPIPVSTSSGRTCPAACPFNSNDVGGCYAASGPVAIHWRKVTEGERGSDYAQFLNEVRAIPKGSLWRHNQAGDLAGAGDALDKEALHDLVSANRGRRGFTYTHKPLEAEGDRDAIRAANANGFTVNLSGNNPSHADALADMDAGPVVTVLASEYERRSAKGEWTETVAEYNARIAALPPLRTPAGRAITVCPAARMDIDCARCGLCAVATRKQIVGFPAHGTGRRKASAIASR